LPSFIMFIFYVVDVFELCNAQFILKMLIKIVTINIPDTVP